MDKSRDLFGNLDSPFLYKLASGLKAKDVMTYNVITLKKDLKVKEAKELMRLKKISGIPIVNDENHLIGIISIDDIIRWLEKQDLHVEIDQFMTKDVVSVGVDQPIIEIFKKFKRYKVGRFPVVNGENILIGIISPGDVVIKLLQIIEENMIFQQEGSTVKKVKGFEKDLENDESQVVKLEYELDGSDLNKAGEASSHLKQILSKMDRYSGSFMRKVAIVTYEAEVNVVIHAYRGIMKVWINPEFIKIVFEDEGPGISDIELALQPGWSTATEQIRELGFGAGMGLFNMKRWSDEMKIESTPGKGTIVTAIIYTC
ncbi:MAG: CBS domain-containing protein [Halanaerobiales bacterium]|nr:CBS domain-containing protein [Halanaerobiales bacterium]